MYGPESIVGCFVEPIAGSTGTPIPPIGYLERLREICDKHGIVLVFDEVITGLVEQENHLGLQNTMYSLI